MAFTEVIERAQGVSGELVLRRAPAGLEIVANGVFLVSAANAASSRALVAAAWPHVDGDALRVLIGGLGIGDALDEALACERVASVTVAELEPVVVRWFHEHGGEPAGRAQAAERAGRARIVVADVADVLGGAAEAWDVVALDTDNGPEWLVRGENARLYAPAGLCAVRAAAAARRRRRLLVSGGLPQLRGRPPRRVRRRADGGGRRRDRRPAARVHDVRGAQGGRRLSRRRSRLQRIRPRGGTARGEARRERR